MSNEKTKKQVPLILAIETATRAGGVAITRGENMLAAIAGNATVSHSINLLEMVERVLSEAGLSLADVDLFAVAVGPGSFTGLRIGLATAKAFAVHLHRSLVGVPTLAALAHASQLTGNIVALLPAGRGEVFAQQFISGNQIVTAVAEPQHLSPAEVVEKYAGLQDLSFVGDGVRMIEDVRVHATHDSDAAGREASELALAPSVAALALRAYQEGQAVAPDELRALYVRASDAEINERWQQQKLQQSAQN